MGPFVMFMGGIDAPDHRLRHDRQHTAAPVTVDKDSSDMNMSPGGIALTQQFEECRLTAYPDSGGVFTIGWGTTHYPDGTEVQRGDTCSQAEADTWLAGDLASSEEAVSAMTTATLTPGQFDALVDFVYNEGRGAYFRSHLRLRVNANPADPAIRAEFMKWYFAAHQPLLGLWSRRHAEADHYEGIATLCPPMPDPPVPLRAA